MIFFLPNMFHIQEMNVQINIMKFLSIQKILLLFLKDWLIKKNDYKKISKKRNEFRNQCKKKYFINDNRLYYKYNDNGRTKNLKIPYKAEKNIILKNIHINNKHSSKDNMRELVKKSGFYR